MHIKYVHSSLIVLNTLLPHTGVEYIDLPINKVRQVTLAHMDVSSPDDDSSKHYEADSPAQADSLLELQQPLQGVQLYVCCHGSRDTRCGILGNSLVTALDKLIKQNQLQNMLQVFKCSHVGGHKVCLLCLFLHTSIL